MNKKVAEKEIFTADFTDFVAILEDGTSLVFFHNTNEPPDINPYSSPPDPGGDVYAQLFDVNGVAVGSPYIVNTDTYHAQYNPVVLQFANGEFVVAWSQSQNGSTFAVVYQRFDADGQTIGSQEVVTTLDDPIDTMTLTPTSGNGFVIYAGRTDETFTVDDTAPTLFSEFRDVVTLPEPGTYLALGGADIVTGSKGDDIVDGGAGADKLFGKGGDDHLYGGEGNDRLYGDKGEDVLDGGEGNDLLKGGKGADTFIFNEGNGQDLIVDFRDDVDTLWLDDSLWGGGLTKQQVIDQFASVDGRDVVFDFGTDEIRLRHFSDLPVLIDDIDFI